MTETLTTTPPISKIRTLGGGSGGIIGIEKTNFLQLLCESNEKRWRRVREQYLIERIKSLSSSIRRVMTEMY